MDLTLYRNYNPNTGKHYDCKGYTIGHLYIENKFFADTIEDEDRGSTLDMVFHSTGGSNGYYTDNNGKKVAEKKYGITAIPKGKYILKKTYSSKFATRTWGKKYNGYIPLMVNAKTGKEDYGYGGARLHPFNTAQECLGCISVGKNNVKGKVTSATEYFYEIMDNYIVPAWNKGETIYLTIK